MNLEKLKPWNWFKHEGSSNTEQIPVTRSDADQALVSNPPNQYPIEGRLPDSWLRLHREMDRLFDHVWHAMGAPSPSSYLFNGKGQPGLLDNYRASIDISGDESRYEVSVDVPGMKEPDLSIDVRGRVLTLSGEKQEKQEERDKRFYRVERSYGSFQRTLTLPDDADTDGIEASLREGVLTIHIPRNAKLEADVKRIGIST